MEYSDKPDTMTLKEFLFRKLEQESGYSREQLSAVVNFQFRELREKFKTEKTIEISHFGKFIWREHGAKMLHAKKINALKKRYARLDEMEAEVDRDERAIAVQKEGIERMLEDLDELNVKMYGCKFEGDVRGMEKPFVPRRGNQKSYEYYKSRKNGNLPEV